MLRIFEVLLFGIWILFSQVLAQSSLSTIKGRILTNDGKPADGVTVFLRENNYVTVTQRDGTYVLKVRPGKYTVQYKILGMVAKESPLEVVSNAAIHLPEVSLEVSSIELDEVVITGQFAPISLNNSVYLVRTLSHEQIRLRNATKVQEVLSDQLGVRFTNDLTLGTTDISLMGMSGQRVKILLDGVPLLDRGDTRESLNQIDINQIDHIELVEGPMSVSYGSDALGGVINLITQKGAGGENFRVSGRIQEETAGNDYKGFQGSGTHHEHVGVNWQHKGWQLDGHITRNNFNGAQLGWLPKDQLLGNVTTGYRNNTIHIWYRLDAEDETIKNNGAPNINTHIQTDQHYLSNRWMHQLQVEWNINSRMSFSGAASYTDYSRRTQTTTLDVLTGDRRLSLGAGEQDKSMFDSKFFRSTLQYRISNSVSLQPGAEISLTGSSGARILGTPTINDYAFFVSSEVAVTPGIHLRPGLRFIKNSVYDAPPVIPSINAKVSLSKALDLRLAYARGFRSPALRELYFDFFDASHSIRGNEHLEAEFSNSFNASVALKTREWGSMQLKSELGAFYNDFNNLITTGYDQTNPAVMTYINIDKYRTTGGTWNNTVYYQNLQVGIGFSYTGVYNRLHEEDTSLPGLTWYPEVNANLLYHLKKIRTDVSLFYKFNGKLPSYETTIENEETIIHRAERSAYHIADFTINKYINNRLSLAGGVKNLFNVTNVRNTSADVGGAHSTGGPVPLGYGRSFFLGLNFQFSNY
ncbi:outer membrane receptor for ferrienterochelin and colicins [bacterium A37T11]|nr:outer membrane receptor for ferrienterochelin and colicins [bacterium A37T11]